MQGETLGEVAEGWTRDFARQNYIFSPQPPSLESVVKLFDTKLQSRFNSARRYVEKLFPEGNNWIDTVLANKKLPQRIRDRDKEQLTAYLLDLVLATDLVIAMRDNQGQERQICVDVTCNSTKEKEKLNVVQGKRADDEETAFNPNQNIPTVRKQLGLDKHLVLVIDPQHPPKYEVLLNRLYAFANNPNQTASINLHPLAVQRIQKEGAQINQEVARQQIDSKTLAIMEQLSERELLNVFQQVKTYFSQQPQAPPEQSRQQAVHEEINTLQGEVERLKEQRNDLFAKVEKIQKNPLRMFKTDYDKSLTQLEQTIAAIDRTSANQQCYQEQLQQWQKLGEIRASWLNDLRTQKMQQVAAALNLPQIREKLGRAKAQSMQLEAAQHLKPSKQRGRGPSL